MDIAYCPYCGQTITVRGQPYCANCFADILDIWKLLNSGFQLPSVVRPVFRRQNSLDWIAPAIIISLGLVLFALTLMVLFFGFPWLINLFTRLNPSGLVVVKVIALLVHPLTIFGRMD